MRVLNIGLRSRNAVCNEHTLLRIVQEFTLFRDGVSCQDKEDRASSKGTLCFSEETSQFCRGLAS